MSYCKFDRHAHMNSETRREILDIIMEIGYGDNTFMLTNSMYGLFDGYLYDELIQYADEVTMSKALYRRILKVFNTVCQYPKYARYVEPAGEYNEPEPVEYRVGMGVAEGKLYLATI
jgi:hypothetical protein